MFFFVKILGIVDPDAGLGPKTLSWSRTWGDAAADPLPGAALLLGRARCPLPLGACLLYTSDAADDVSWV